MSNPRHDEMSAMQRWEAKTAAHEYATLEDVTDVLRQMSNHGVDKATTNYCWGRIL